MVLSAKPSKQRKALYNLPWHKAIKLMSAPLSKELRQRFSVKSIPVRVNDSVKIVSGGYKGRSGKVVRVDVKRRLVFIEGITEMSQKGKTKLVGIHVSNIMITKLDLSDKYRRQILERKGVSAEIIQKEIEEAEKAESQSKSTTTQSQSKEQTEIEKEVHG
ncbi:50S ribosomal protein L24 [Candidatus Marsarchaeota G2 archaeon ECH_B_SAG-F08]|jgi:large subunit ribosomal protein L24|uniref:Large ribosomal subunit protein uL24 n=3 Tax=Candidatus Marsarchaeota TaxID=1978152 RepID=A0A2R6AK73_9ARCH|nr:MAG: 50S ribosomal protein L24 [Candidatus Marsarchaeota G1 archaeon BE_D]PSN88878.1 MAG: 50S ribosomal protein L24 [Candidatus Marsarchaeota G1 archaeon OSP_C]PSN97510.1 MAG: 50S ribosomal protein L24 [Candidatus Marsarchaeota G2 archaeon ECH_B_SAG-F08]